LTHFSQTEGVIFYAHGPITYILLREISFTARNF
jgi:hypothetical protein